MNRRSVFGLIRAATAALAIAACPPTAKTTWPDIASILSTNDQFSTLVAAASAAGLVETLAGPGPYTVFAPSDYAFSKLPAGTVADLVKPENKDKLVKILTYHVVPGTINLGPARRQGPGRGDRGRPDRPRRWPQRRSGRMA